MWYLEIKALSSEENTNPKGQRGKAAGLRSIIGCSVSSKQKSNAEKIYYVEWRPGSRFSWSGYFNLRPKRNT